MNNILKGVTLCVAVACLFFAREASAACMKWSTNLQHCDIDPKFCGSSVVATEQELEQYYGYLYADSASQVCKQWGQALYGLNGKVYNTATGQKQCWTDGDGVLYEPNGVLDSLDPISPVISYGEIPRESCCEEDLEGFHEITPDKWYTTNAAGTVVAMNPVAGGSFTFETVGTHPSQISLIRGDNMIGRGDYLSDLLRPEVPTSLKNKETAECNGVLSTSHPNWKCKPQVDHIIPRMDIKGCKCGKNSSKNAQVLSAGLNNYLSNYCGSSPQGQLRQQLIAFYKNLNAMAVTPHVAPPTYAATTPTAPVDGTAHDFALVLSYRFTPREATLAAFGIRG